MSLALDAFTVAAVTAGLVFFLAGSVGLLRFPDTLTRLHALTKADSLGFSLIVIGLIPQSPDVATGAKLAVVWALMLIAAAASSQLVGRHVRREGEDA